MGKRLSDVAIVRLRHLARDAGISIRVKRAAKSRPERVYDLVEKASGRLLYGGVALADIEPTLARITEDRADAGLMGSRLATERPSRRRPLVTPLPLRGARGDVGGSTGTRRWIPLSAALLGLATLVVAMQQPAFQDPDPDGGVLDASAPPRGDLRTAPASPRGEASLAPASSAPVASGSVASSPAAPSIGSSEPPGVTP